MVQLTTKGSDPAGLVAAIGSWLTNLIFFYDRVTSLVDEGKDVDAAHLDFSKAFGTASFIILFKKLAAHSSNRAILCWVKKWLGDQALSVVVNDGEL